MEAVDGKVNGFYLTMGKYDAVLIIEVPSDEVAATVFLSGGRQGNVRTEIIEAFSEDQYRNIIAKVQ